MDGYCGTRKTGIGLVLSGGGAKGAYEIGVWQALRDVGLDKHITGVSGTSIGAINSLLFAAGDVETAKTLWTDMSSSESRRISRTEIAVFSREYARRREKNPLLSPYYDWEEDIFVSQPELNRHISRYAHGNGTALREKYRVFSTITPKEEFWPRASELVNHQVPADEGKENPHYVSWATLSAHEIVQLVLASSAHPLAYEPVRFRGREWLDGGLFDNTPVRPLYDCGYRNFIIVWLSRAPTPLRMPEKTERCRIVHFLPGPDFDDSLFATFTIDADLSRQRIEAGYQDALRQIGSQLALIRKMVNSA